MLMLLRPNPNLSDTGLRARYGGLDAMRALGVAAVVVFHVAPQLLPGGYVGVDVFFVVSGFLITGLLLREYSDTGTVRLGRFAARRVRRLLPAAAVMVVTVAAVALLVGGDVLAGLPGQLLGAVTMTANWQQLAAGSDYFAHARTGLLDNFWSLAIEEQFYLVWPVVLLVVLRRRGGIRLRWTGAAVVVAAVVPIVLTGMGLTDAAYLATPAHSFGLLTGVFLAVLHRRFPVRTSADATWWGWAVLSATAVGLVAVMVAPGSGVPTNRSVTTLIGSVLAAGMIAAFVSGGAGLGAAADRGLMGWLGTRSYGVYLWHLPLIVLADAVLRPLGWSMPGRVVAVAVAVGAAAVSYRYLERPLRSRPLRESLRRPIVASAVVVIAVVGVIVSSAVGYAAPTVTSAQRDGLDAGASTSAAPSEGTDEAAPSESTDDGSTMVAIGDSVMLASKHELEQQFPGITVDAVESRQLTTAPELVRRHLRQSPATRVVVIGLGVNGVGGSDDLRAAIRAAGDRRVVLVDVSAPVSWESTVNAQISQVASEFPNVQVADWRAQARSHPQLIASDGIHPGDAGGKLYAGSVAAAIGAFH